MPITIQFESIPAGLFQTYSEQGFRFSTLVTGQQGYPDAFWNRTQVSDLGTGGYLINQYASDTVIVKPTAGGAFGASAIQVNGFSFLGWDRTTPVTGTSVVEYHFTGVKADGSLVTHQFTTDATDGFQTVALPAGFAAGLVELNWFINGGTGWGAFDNLVLNLNTAPVARPFTAAVTGGEMFTGQLVATDADNQPLTFLPVGTLPSGVVVDSNGTFYVQPLPGDADLTAPRTVSFQYRAFDGTDYSPAQTVSVTLKPVPAGPDLWGTRKADTLTGTAGSEKIFGLEGHDRISAGAGADKVWAGDGKDTVLGGAGADQMWGEEGQDSLDGGAGDDILMGGDHKDTLIGGAGADTLSGGDDNDLFVFGSNSGHDVILDFRSGHWDKTAEKWPWGHGEKWEWDPADQIRVSPALFGDFATLIAHARQTWYGVVIATEDGQNSITLVGAGVWSLQAEDFVFA
ncbi:calcium-binding protein [Phenylobacterium sp.]|uniref:calcium-binding protein n=1 Tax=Phenylobacterium sp. TaxID=1871053 RepID=UPI0035B08CDC